MLLFCFDLVVLRWQCSDMCGKLLKMLFPTKLPPVAIVTTKSGAKPLAKSSSCRQ
jgi:hypothetical protein